MTRISVAIATYNGAKYLAQQLQSIAAQTTGPCEVVICDDGSADNTLEVIDSCARVAPFPVRVVRNAARLNYRANFMKAAQSCSGDLIAFCDQDDIWRADKLSVVASAFANDPDVLLVHHNARIFSAESGVTGQLYDELRPSRVDGPLCRSPFDLPPGFTQIFRRSLLLLSELREATVDYWGEPGAALAHDQWIYILASSLGKVSYVKEKLADYRQHEKNLYGMRRKTQTRWHALRARLTGLSNFGHLETAFDAIARALSAATEYPIGDEFARRAAAATELYRELAQAYGDRRQAFGAASLTARASAWQRLWRRGGYRRGGGFFFAGRAPARDLVHGVCLARLRDPPTGLYHYDPALTMTPAC